MIPTIGRGPARARRVLAGVIAVAAAACLVPASARPSDDPGTKTVTFADRGGVARLVVGERLIVKLEVCSDCGYRWATRTAPDRRVLHRLAQGHQKIGDCAAPCTGGEAYTLFRYRARAGGRTSFVLEYIPPGASGPAKTFELRVRVRS
jgi:predicted secreted protein